MRHTTNNNREPQQQSQPLRHTTNNNNLGALVVAQLVERSLSTPEARSSNPVIGNFYLTSIVFYEICIVVTKIKEIEAGNGP